jgi:hypothetical protein
MAMMTNAATASISAMPMSTRYTRPPLTNRTRAGHCASGGNGCCMRSPCSVHSKMAAKPIDMPKNTAEYIAIETRPSKLPASRYCATVAVANGISTTKSSSSRFRNSSVRSTALMPLTSTWWFTQMMPIRKKLST